MKMKRTDVIALYEKVIAAIPDVERKGDTMPYTSLNGHMFSVVHKDGTVALRLPSPQREAFLEKYQTTLSSQYGSVQPEYVVVPEKLLGNTRALKPYFDLSFAYVGSLKPKATKARKGAARSTASPAKKTRR
jgi:hypothetical protein